ncbi:MAG: glycosyltransferase family 2 protein [Verrucomicrobiota bacterium]
MKNPPPHITVCICTCKRPRLLKKLLEKLGCQLTDGLFSYSMVVADNDSLESARPIVDALRCGGPEIVYCVEPERNIARVRNTALRRARGEFVAFIDDDEFPEPNWLLALLSACKEHQSDGVLGPVRPFFEEEPPRWLVRGKFCERPEYPTGTLLDWRHTRTGNVLFKREIIQDIREPFRSQFGDGGEDNDFFRRMMERGRIFTWCNEAAVSELVPPGRFTRTYQLRRALLRGQNQRHFASWRSIAKSVAACALYSIALPFLLFSGQSFFMQYLIRICDHMGALLATLGVKPMGDKYIH